ncbi:hypothetical protein FOXB_15750, partial [Fusarium oxysporum f. sp. conglutinans Fo5176]
TECEAIVYVSVKIGDYASVWYFLNPTSRMHNKKMVDSQRHVGYERLGASS